MFKGVRFLITLLLIFFIENMILNTKLSHEAEYIGDIQENRVGIDKENLGFITTLLTSNLYSKPLESFFRETVSNAYDSHMEAGTTAPILLLVEDVENVYSTYRISIRDYGVGISPERFDKIYKNIGSSTKRDSNDFIGMFGIGRFSCLACVDVAHITSYYDGVKYSYVMYKNGGGINIDMLSTVKGDYKNGLEVSIEKYLYPSDFPTALLAISLFDNIHVEYKGSNSLIKQNVGDFNNRVINRYKTFATCSLLSSSLTQYCKVGNVLYPSLSNHLLSTRDIIIDLPIGSVDITPNREALQFTEYTKATIDKQISLVQQELQELLDEESSKDMTLRDFYNKFVDKSFITLPLKQGGDLHIDPEDVNLDFSKTTIDGESLPVDFVKHLKTLRLYEVPSDLVYKSLHTQSRSHYWNFGFGRILSQVHYLAEKKDKVTKQVTMEYFKEKTSKATIILTYEGIPALKTFIERTVFSKDSTAASHTDFIFKHLSIKELSNDDVPQSYIDMYREEQRSKRKKNSADTGSIPIRVYTDFGYRMSYLKHIQAKGLIIYSPHVAAGEDSIIKTLAGLLYPHPGVASVITVRKESIKLLENNKRYISIEKFLYTRNKILSRLATYVTIRDIMASVDRKDSDLLIYLYDTPLLKEFKSKYEVEASEMTHSIGISDRDSIIKYYTDRGWVNQTDIQYFTPTKTEITAYEYWLKLKSNRDSIIRNLVIKEYGVLRRIGLTRGKRI